MTMISILATSHRLPSSKIYISSRLLRPPLSFQKGCSRKVQTGVQPAEMQRDSLCTGHDCITDAEQWPRQLRLPAPEQKSGEMLPLQEG